jgi:hypothetical protein
VKFEPGHLPVYLVQLDVFERCTGLSPDAVHKMIGTGEWTEGYTSTGAAGGSTRT